MTSTNEWYFQAHQIISNHILVAYCRRFLLVLVITTRYWPLLNITNHYKSLQTITTIDFAHGVVTITTHYYPFLVVALITTWLGSTAGASRFGGRSQSLAFMGQQRLGLGATGARASACRGSSQEQSGGLLQDRIIYCMYVAFGL